MKLSKKGKIVVTVLVIFILIVAFLIFKVVRLNHAIHDPKDNTQSLTNGQNKIKNKQPISVAIFGVDSDAKRAKANLGQRTDTILIASINPNKGKTKLVSIPRDTRAEIAGYDRTEKIAHAYAYGGPKTAIKTIEGNFGIPIDGYVTVDMDGFEKLIDIFGGVDVKSNATFEYNGSQFKQGESTHLNSEKALNYVRSRKEDGAGGDEGRTERQRQVIAALSEKMSGTHNIFKLNKILKVSEQNVKTSFDIKSLKTLYSQYKGAGNAIDKLSISGQDLIESDGIWYFEPDTTDKQEKMKEYKHNLQSS
ncbi:LytR family transcriptional regulator [Staphylococcus gallinarum]|uniref:LytR family transcriptional regulator n=1 Tax=Staphylococcus gallinarum TaxID=1293 RepID=A0A3A0W1F7_STAGA|nr:LCP family protein [Staphylococcus gallinarum]RIP34792.1 LytR family transcriptional regulator [Staphylococcus gallinarum]